MKFVIVCALLLLAACGKNPAAPETRSSDITRQTSPGAKPASSSEPASAVEEDRAKTLERLTQALRRFSAEHRRVPQSLDELVSAGYLPELPTPPGGKIFVFDDQLRVTLKDAK